MYSSNTRNVERINRFFSKLGYIPKYKESEPAAIGGGQMVVLFEVPGFKGSKLEGKLLEEWQTLPIECV